MLHGRLMTTPQALLELVGDDRVLTNRSSAAVIE
jgi:hypothetical protein